MYMNIERLFGSSISPSVGNNNAKFVTNIPTCWINSQTGRSQTAANVGQDRHKHRYKVGGSSNKPVSINKLAAEGDRGGGLLIPAREPDDSGIDSDDAVRRLILAHQRLPFSDESSSDDELQIPSPTTHRHRNERRASLKNPEEDHDLVIMQWPQEQYTKDQNTAGETTPDRSSPPLYEVELTASDEDDDASVLELVIPMHSSRYQRVPTSSPKKSKPKVVKRYFCSMICCGRK
uniref:SFRICE_017338 n=1 Tax=Spodoptera frugiperda TaxID=7108 RepID=A0A2H1VYA3_SPOFR